VVGKYRTDLDIGPYSFNKHKSKKSDKNIREICFYTNNELSQNVLDELAKKSEIICESIFFARDLANEPGNRLNPSKFALILDDKFRKSQIKTTIFCEKEIDNMGMGLFSAVSKGSDEDAKMIVLDYTPKKYSHTLVLVGKGLTFDSGGLSLKPADAMTGMHMDMSGAAAVAGAMNAVDILKPKDIRIVAVIGAAENMPGHKAQKPEISGNHMMVKC
jgi:leucyl aminopeptidase